MDALEAMVLLGVLSTGGVVERCIRAEYSLNAHIHSVLATELSRVPSTLGFFAEHVPQARLRLSVAGTTREDRMSSMASTAHTWQDGHRWQSRRQLRRRQSRHRKGWLAGRCSRRRKHDGPVASGGSGGGFDEAGCCAWAARHSYSANHVQAPPILLRAHPAYALSSDLASGQET